MDDTFLLNRDLDFNETGFTCNSEKFVLWTSVTIKLLDPLKLFLDPRDHFAVCLPKNDPGKSIYRGDLEELIVRDFGFQGRSYIPTSFIER